MLRCPVCAAELSLADGQVRCAAGHGYDLGRGGYLNLRTGRARRITGDGAEMIAAREAFLGAGHYRPLTDRLGELAAAASGDEPAPAVLEIGAGTGHHLAGVLAALPAGASGVAVDVSRHALRRAARAHPRIGAVGFDAGAAWPVADGCVHVLVDVFAPRHPAEMRRVLHPAGTLLIVTPAPGHLAELREPLGLVGIQPDKGDRLDERFASRFVPESTETLDVALAMSLAETVDLAMMGPTGHHLGPAQLSARARERWPAGLVRATACFHLRRYRPVPVEP
ncbi:putative RNA methyltransferase [Frankia sp. AgKG'84/4]|uniref:putative RNA methyltransferase n=1 Tax=Frankia sp. AgKG'84/4 TaxID=573490 RepID=UPI00200D8FA9|nr:methyltransferase domain-containing protein [Frankia sp. AgKG'84/4]MCL9798158.1 methyltransferase type 12 [Frankia sp. AgKG'84/4]